MTVFLKNKTPSIRIQLAHIIIHKYFLTDISIYYLIFIFYFFFFFFFFFFIIFFNSVHNDLFYMKNVCLYYTYI